MSTKGYSNQLPASWHYARLGAVADVVNGFAFGTQYQGHHNHQYPFIKVSDMNAEGAKVVVRAAANTVDNTILQALRAKTYPAGTVIFPKVGGALLTNKKRILGVEAAFDNNVMGLVPKSVLPMWLFYFMLNIDLRLLANTQALPSIRQSDVGALTIPLPPLPEQHRIIALLTEQLAQVDVVRAATHAQLSAARALPSAYLRNVFDSPEAKEWPIYPLGSVGNIGSGLTIGRQLNSGSTQVPYLRVANVKDGHLDLSTITATAATDTEIERCRLQYGDLLLTEGGDPDKLGRGTFWQDELPLCLHQNHIFRVRFDLGQYDPHFLSAQIGSAYGKAYFLAHAKQTTGIATINQRVLAGFPLLSPPIDKQRNVVIALNHRLDHAGELQSILTNQLDTLEKLSPALLRRAFAGEL